MHLRRWQPRLVWVALWLASAAPALGSCVGDCNSNGSVSIAELAIGTKIGLGVAAASECLGLDADGRDGVTIDELVRATHNAAVGCPQLGTPTPTPTTQPTATPTPTHQPTATPPPGCGDGNVDFANGETCDDGNTLDGDACPADCRIATCIATSVHLAVDVTFSAPSGAEVAGATVFLRYPDGVVRIPGMANDGQVQGRVTNQPDNAFSVPNDLDYGLRVVLVSVDAQAFPAGRLFSVDFDVCESATQPTAADFSCRVENAADTSEQALAGVTCTAGLQ